MVNNTKFEAIVNAKRTLPHDDFTVDGTTLETGCSWAVPLASSAASISARPQEQFLQAFFLVSQLLGSDAAIELIQKIK
jgi:hypothetical protein